MTSEAAAAPPTTPGIAIPESELRRLYADYRVRQARALLGTIPREGIRPLYRRAREWSSSDGGTSSIVDPMGLLVAFCETLLPLPTFDVWREDLRNRPDAHLRDMEASAEAPSPTAPATIDTRRFRRDGTRWEAHLRGFRDRGAWRGFIVFEELDALPRRPHRTSLIFREESAADLRHRFRAFESVSLEAFLRSSMP